MSSKPIRFYLASFYDLYVVGEEGEESQAERQTQKGWSWYATDTHGFAQTLALAVEQSEETWRHVDKIKVFARMTPDRKERVMVGGCLCLG
jgi:hypothetical protein